MKFLTLLFTMLLFTVLLFCFSGIFFVAESPGQTRRSSPQARADLNKRYVDKLLKSDSILIQRYAALKLGFFRNSYSLMALLNSLHKEDKFLRRNALRSIRRIRDLAACPNIAPWISDPDIQKEVIHTLGDLDCKENVWDVVHMLSDKRQSVRVASIHALRKMKDKRTLRFLVKLLFDEDEVVRFHATSALSVFKEKRTAKFLRIVQQQDPSQRLREAAAISLRKLGIFLAVSFTDRELQEEESQLESTSTS